METTMDGRKPTPKPLLTVSRRLRRESTPAEMVLWKHLRNRQIAGAKFRRQVMIDRFVVDFYCNERRLIVEVDGSTHDQPDNRAADRERQAHLEALGYSFLRFRNEEVQTNIEHVLHVISEFVSKQAEFEGIN